MSLPLGSAAAVPSRAWRALKLCLCASRKTNFNTKISTPTSAWGWSSVARAWRWTNFESTTVMTMSRVDRVRNGYISSASGVRSKKDDFSLETNGNYSRVYGRSLRDSEFGIPSNAFYPESHAAQQESALFGFNRFSRSKLPQWIHLASSHSETHMQQRPLWRDHHRTIIVVIVGRRRGCWCCRRPDDFYLHMHAHCT